MAPSAHDRNDATCTMATGGALLSYPISAVPRLLFPGCAKRMEKGNQLKFNAALKQQLAGLGHLCQQASQPVVVVVVTLLLLCSRLTP